MGTTTVEIRQLADNSGGTSIAPLTVAEAVFLNENVTLDKLVGNLDINGLNSNTLALTNSLTYKGVYNAIRYVGTSSTNSMIRFLDNNLNGDGSGISIGGGGATILGGGESALIMESALDRNDREVLYLCNDSQIDFYTNCQSGTGSAVHTWIDTSGFFNGSVKRGIIISNNNVVETIIESSCIKEDNQVICTPLNKSIDSFKVSLDQPVSMLMNVFNKDILNLIEKTIKEELTNPNNNLLDYEVLLPDVMDKSIKLGNQIDLVTTDSKWMGMTYKTDEELVKNYINKQIEDGVYPYSLW